MQRSAQSSHASPELGWLGPLTRLLERAGECHVWLMYRYELASEPLPLRRAVPCRIGLARPDEVEELAMLTDPRDDKHTAAKARMFQARFDAGSLCFVARAEEGIVSYNWIRIGSAVGAHGVRMILADDEIYTTDAYTVRAWRGRGLHPALNRAMLVHANRLGFRVAYTLVRADNLRSAVTLPRVGWQHAGTMLHWHPQRWIRRPFWFTRGEIHPMRTAARHAQPEPPAQAQPALPELLRSFDERRAVSSRPWSNVYRLSGAAGVAYLKIVAPSQAGTVRLSRLLSDQIAHAVPHVIACHGNDPAWLLMSDHGAVPADVDPPPNALAALLGTFAELQAHAARRPLLLAAGPLLDAGDAWLRLNALLAEDGAAARWMVSEQALAIRHALASHEARLTHCWKLADDLPLTLEHGRLDVANAAFRPDGSCLLMSWNHSVTGPAGLALHRLFGRCTRALRLLDIVAGRAAGDDAETVDAAALDGYVEALHRARYADRRTLLQSLPGSIALGPVAALLALELIDNDEPEQKAPLQTLWSNLLGQVIEVGEWLAVRS